MALRAVTDHPKFFRLKLLLQLNKSCALGYLEALWHFCGKYTPQGNIGKYTDADIEAWLEWDGEEGALVAACVKAGWLRVDETSRLIVHDWSQYADEIVHTDLARKCLRFADGSLPKTGRLNKHERARYMLSFPEGTSCGPVPLRGEEQEAGEDDAAAAPEDGDTASQTESDTSQTKSDLATKPEPEPASKTNPRTPPQGGALRRSEGGNPGAASGGDGSMSAEELEELADVNRMRAGRHDPPLGRAAWREVLASRGAIANPTDPVPVRARRQRRRGRL